MPPDDIISNDVLDTALRLQEFCRGRGWRFCFIGGLAVQKWSEPRVTDDVDLTLFTGLGTEAPFIDALLALDWVEPRIPRAREFAQTRRVLLLQTKGGVGIDVAMGAFPFEEEAVRRGQEITLLPGRALRLCTAEDLIIRRDRAFSREELARRVMADLSLGRPVAMVTPEDAVLSKLEWARRAGDSERQLADAAGILAVTPTLDRAYVEKWAH